MEKDTLSEARLRHQLDVQSRQINRVFSHHRVPATVVGGTVRSRIVSFDLQTQLAAGLERVRDLTEDLKQALGVGDLAFTREGGQWRLRVTRPDDASVPLIRLLASNPPASPTTAVIGMADDGAPVQLRFGSGRVKHVLVAGEPGAGKTTLLRAIAASLALTNRQSALQLLVMDASGLNDDPATGTPHPLRPLGYLPHMLTDPTGTADDCAAVLRFLAEEMEYRRRDHVHMPRIVTLIDHVVTLLDKGGEAVRNDLTRLIQYGSAVGLHLVLSTDQPDAHFLRERVLQAGVSVRIVGKVTSPEASKPIAGRVLEQAPLLYGEGDFLAVVGDDVTYFQAGHIGDYDLHMALSEMAGADRPRLLALPYNPRPRIRRAAEPKDKTFRWQSGAMQLDEQESDANSGQDIVQQ